MNKVAKGLLSGCLVLIVIGVLGAVFLWRYVSSHKDEWAKAGKEVVHQGEAEGASLDERGCLRRGLEKYGNDFTISGRISARMWMKGCLETSSPGENGLCASAPAPNAFTDLIRWQTSICTGNDSAVCSDLLQETMGYCASSRRAAKQ